MYQKLALLLLASTVMANAAEIGVDIPGIGKIPIGGKLGKLLENRPKEAASRPVPESEKQPSSDATVPAGSTPSPANASQERAEPRATGSIGPGAFGDYVVLSVAIDVPWKPAGEFYRDNVRRKCSEDPNCANLVKGAGAALKVPLQKMSTVAANLQNEVRNPSRGPVHDRIKALGEKYLTIALPSGYEYCSAYFSKRHFIYPHGDTGKVPTVLGMALTSGLYLETWTPATDYDEKRVHITAHIAVIGVERSLANAKFADRTCHKPDSRVIVSCRGDDCANTTDTGQSLQSGETGKN